MPGTLALAFLAGALSIVNPCVLPILPAVLAGAAAKHRLAPLALAGGLTLSFTAIGLLFATVGFGLEVGAELFRLVAATLMVGLGAVLAVPALELRLAVATGPVANWAEHRLGGMAGGGLGGQMALGALLGAVWIPCVGPTLGAASLLASRGEHLATVAATMLAFGLGAALPLGFLGLASRHALLAWRGRLNRAGGVARIVLGGTLIVIGGLILTGLDKRLEAALVEAAPDWLVDLTTRF